jgi:flagellar M-ring protein FliF
MDFLNKSIAQVSELFRSMTPGARITAGLLLAVVVTSLGYLFHQSTAGPDAYLFGGEPLSDGQLNKIEAAIAEKGLSGYAREGNRIRVPAGQQAKYVAAVADAGALPPNFNTILESALAKGGPWESREATRERLKIARQQTLAEIVRAMSWVDDAVVLYDEHESRNGHELGLNKQVTASVSVQPVAGEVLDGRRAKMLQKLVASAVNMNPKDVNVTNLGDGSGYGSGESIGPEIFDDEYMRTKVAFEMQKRESILDALRDIPGVRVQVNADFDDSVEETTHDVKPDPKSAIQHETTSKDESAQTAADSSGRPGVTVQGPNGKPGTQSAQVQKQNTTKSETTDTQNVVGLTDSRVLKKGYKPKEIWATVKIPGSYIENLWRVRNPGATTPPKPDDLRLVQDDVVPKIENIVDPLLILTSTKAQALDNFKHVKVVVLDSLPSPTIEPPSTASKALAWTGQYWNTLAMLGVAVFSLLILRSVVKSAPPTAAGPSAAPALMLHADEPATRADASEPTPDDRPRLRLKKGKSLKDDLVQIVHEDPDAAAEILRSWIGKAG